MRHFIGSCVQGPEKIRPNIRACRGRQHNAVIKYKERMHVAPVATIASGD